MRHTLIISAVLLGVIASAVAQETQKPGFKTTLAIGVALTEGNSETLQANAALLTEGEKDGLGSVRASMEGNYGESTVPEQTGTSVPKRKETTVENARAFANAKKTISPKTFVSLDFSTLYDDIAQIDYRTTLGPGLGVYLIKTDLTSISAEVGPTYIWEKVAGVNDSYLALRLAERIDRILSKTSKVWQALEYIPKSDDFDAYLLNAELGIEAAVNSRMSLRIVLQNKYDSTPAAELENNDLTMIAGIKISL